jgi:transcriptional regulator with XRE-family HTH domain
MISSAQNPIDIHIGNRVQMARALSGMSREDLAEALGITPKTMFAYEVGERIGAGLLFSIAKILKQPIGYFYEGLPED